ncbi:WD and tetratricopeptide repeats protein 1-like isoform X2 [Lycorma delicatula]|uniref:WD and tetratricopeptide repeats protein 1-like isoform X2 n=1 Tax=Lycorma delicatula TaxID=130591 RepID=UPI003F5163D6
MAQPKNFVYYVKRREIDDSINSCLQKRLHVTESFVNRLGLEKELEGHGGCVNCLEWNSEGRVLASASDDFRVILWDPFHYKQIHTIETGHHGNIFSVKFLPKSNDSIVITGAGDWQIHVHDVSLRETTQICSCPGGRVKRLATTPQLPYLFWSAAEDGGIRQFDMRVPHTCSSDVSNILVYLRTHLGGYAEAKCLAINPCRPEILAVGANDPYVRLYDRRMIKLTGFKESNSSTFSRPLPIPHPVLGDVHDELEVEDNLLPGCVQYYVAGHLPIKQDMQKKYRSLAATYVTFGSNGVDLLVNLGGEQIYLFDTSKKCKPKSFDVPKSALPKEFGGTSNGYSNGFNGFHSGSNGYMAPQPPPSSKKQELPEVIENMKLTANMYFENGVFSHAISLYNEAICRYPNCAVLYGNRAAAYMKRNWAGDMYAALRDCHVALQLDPNHVKAFFRLARCLHELEWKDQAKLCLEVFKVRFPSHASSHACRALDKDINAPPTPPPNPPPNFEAQFGSNKSERSLKSYEEWSWRDMACDYEKRFYGHCNTTTDIKEANFFGSNGQYIMAGSDDGSIYFWDRSSTNNVRILRGDNSIVNCLQPHPSCCLLATSGIDPVVRLWSPQPEDGSENDREVKDRDAAALLNQRRMKADPFDVVLMNMGYRPVASLAEDSSEDSHLRTYNCRAS